MKIIYISNSIIPSKTANSIHVMKMCQAFADNKHEVILLAPDVKQEYEKNIKNVYAYYGIRENFKIKKLFYPNLKGKSVVYTLHILIYLLRNKADLVYGRFVNGCLLASLLRLNTVFESHAPIWTASKIERLAFKYLIKQKYFNKLVVISDALKKVYLSKEIYKDKLKDKILVLHDGSDEVKDMKSKIMLLGNHNNLKVGYVGHLYEGKGMEVIVNIADKLPPNINIHIIGGLKKDISKWKSIIKSDNVYFYGFISQQEITKYINSLDICLLPNQLIVKTYSNKKTNNDNIGAYTSPLKMFDYMAHKKAIISSDLSVLREVLNENNSILVGYNDYEAWINAIIKLKDENLRNKLALNACNDFKYFSWNNRAQLIIKAMK